MRDNPGDITEKRQRFPYGESQHLVKVLAVIANIQHAALEPRAAALFANQLYIREELHFYGHRAVALARFAAPAGYVEREMPGRVAATLGVRSIRKRLANRIERFQVRGRI